MTERTISPESLKRLLGPWRAAGSGAGYGRLSAALRLLILDGRLALNQRLPGERSLAEALGVSRITIGGAFERLRADGFLTSRRGSGSVTTLPCVRSEARGEGGSDDDGLLDFASAVIAATPPVFQAYARALEALPLQLAGAGYQICGIESLRRVIAERYAAFGLPTSPDQIVISAGAQNALALLLRSFARPGDPIALEQPCYPNAIDAIVKANCTPLPFALADGWDIEGIAHALDGGFAKLAYLIPDHQNPTGRVMSAADRGRLLTAAKRGGALVVFDETIAELWFDQPTPAFDPRLDDARLIRIGSLSKCFWGGLRVGWIRAAAPLAAAIAQSRASLDLGVPPLEQLAAAILLTEHAGSIAHQRARLAARQTHLRAALRTHLPGWIAPAAAGGLSLWIKLPCAKSTALVLAARAHGLKLAAGPRFTVRGGCEDRLRLPFSRTEAELDQAVLALTESWRSIQSRSTRKAAKPDGAPVY